MGDWGYFFTGLGKFCKPSTQTNPRDHLPKSTSTAITTPMSSHSATSPQFTVVRLQRQLEQLYQRRAAIDRAIASLERYQAAHYRRARFFQRYLRIREELSQGS